MNNYGTEDHKHDVDDVYHAALKDHSHHDLERLISELRDDISGLRWRVADLEEMANR